MLQRFIFFPFLFILYIVGGLITSNIGQIPPLQSISPLLILLTITGTIIGILQIFVRDWHYAGYFSLLILAFFLLYSHFIHLLELWTGGISQTTKVSFLAFWLFFIMLLGWKKVWIKLGGAKHVTPILNLVFCCALLLQSLTSIPNWIREYNILGEKTDTGYLTNAEEISNIQCKNSPDIYYIISDGHGRSDVLQELFGVDSTSFNSFLESKDFYIADQSYTNYTHTSYSLSSSLNFSYLKPASAGISEIDYFAHLFSQNRIMQELKKCGYHIYATTSGFTKNNLLPVTTRPSEVKPINDFVALIILGSPLETFARNFVMPSVRYEYQKQRDLVNSAFEDIEIISKSNDLKFVIMHIMVPHPPFIFDSNGKPVQPDRGYSALDGSSYPGSTEEYISGYAEQVQYVDKMLIQTIETILSNSTSPPIIIVQGDHGPGSAFNAYSIDKCCLWERSAILNAYYLPGMDTSQLYPEISPVNSFRVILNNYFDTELELLPDRSYYVSYKALSPKTDITDMRDSKNNCARP